MAFSVASTYHPVNVILIALAAGVVYLSALVIYRLFLHPFAKYPGPFWAKTSYFFAFYHAWIGDTGQTQLWCHQKYGPICRYTPDTVLFNDYQAYKDIHGAGKSFKKGKAYAPMNAQPGTWNLAFNPHKREHARRKRIIGRAFTEHSVREAQSYIKTHSDQLCEYFTREYSITSSKWSGPVDIQDPMFWVSLDSTTDLVFGESFNTINDPTLRNFRPVLLGNLRRLGLVAQYPQGFRPGIGKFDDLGAWILPDISQKLMQVISVGATSTMKRLQNPPKGSEERKDVLSYLINGVDPETGTSFSEQDIMAEAILLLMAGGDTVAGQLSALFFYLSRNPASLDRLTGEVRKTFKSADEIALGPAMDSCTYLNASIEEGTRLVGGTAFWRDAEEGGAMVCGEFIPQGLTAGISTYAVSRTEEVFRDPFKFKPERWIPGGEYTDEEIATAKAANQPFSTGPRSCVAKQLAWGMLLLTTTRVLWEFDIKKAEGPEGNKGGGWKGRGRGLEREDEFQMLGSFTIHAEGPVLQFRRRKEIA